MASQVAFTPVVQFIWFNRKKNYILLPFSSGTFQVHADFLYILRGMKSDGL